MSGDFVTRRVALASLAGVVIVKFSGCGTPAVPLVRMLLSLSWDKITSVVMLLHKGFVLINGMLNGEDVQSKFELTDQQARELENGGQIEFDVKLKDGSIQKYVLKPKAKRPSQLIVTDVESDGLADKAGIRPDDAITEYDGVPLFRETYTNDELKRAIEMAKDKPEVSVKLIRNGTQEVTVKVPGGRLMGIRYTVYN